MKLKLTQKFTGNAAELIVEAAKQCRMDVDSFARNAILLMVRQGFEAGEKEYARQQYNTPIRDSGGDSSASESIPSTSGSELSNTEVARDSEQRTE